MRQRIVQQVIGKIQSNVSSSTSESSNGSSGAVAFAPAKELRDLAPKLREKFQRRSPNFPTIRPMKKSTNMLKIIRWLKKALRIFRGKIIEVKKIE